MRKNNDWRPSEDEQKITTRNKEFLCFTDTYFRTQQETHIIDVQASAGFGIRLASPLGLASNCITSLSAAQQIVTKVSRCLLSDERCGLYLRRNI
jgi:hypothetical protein